MTVTELMGYLFEVIDPYSVNRQGANIGEKYRTGVYSEDPSHLREAEAYIRARPDRDRIRVEVLPLARYVPSAEEHQDHPGQVPRRLLPHPQGAHEEVPFEGGVASAAFPSPEVFTSVISPLLLRIRNSEMIVKSKFHYLEGS